MALSSTILSGNARLEQVSSGAPSVKRAPPNDDTDAVQRIQRALVELGFPLPLSFSGGDGQPDGIFGDETYGQVVAFQRRSFPSDPSQWDGRVGQFTLGKMDELLPQDEPDGPLLILPAPVSSASRCSMTTPGAVGTLGIMPTLPIMG